MRRLRVALTALVVAFLLGPLLVVAVVSINENRYMDFPPEGFSLAWYGEMVLDAAWRAAILRSLASATTNAAPSLSTATPPPPPPRTHPVRLS
ncbi:MAG: hypothetical protein ACKO8G_06700, partial [Actinomycetota bacterium]